VTKTGETKNAQRILMWKRAGKVNFEKFQDTQVKEESDKKCIQKFDKKSLEIKLQKTTMSLIEDSLSNIAKLINSRACTTYT
jgi:hypothetical protein